jgi:hypothetical protein
MSSFVFLIVYDSQIYRERCAGAEIALYLNFTMMSFNDPVNDRQSKPDALAFPFGREEGGEKLVQILFTNADPRIADVDSHGISKRIANFYALDHGCGDRQVPAIGHRLSGIEHDIHNGLLDLVEIHEYLGK